MGNFCSVIFSVWSVSMPRQLAPFHGTPQNQLAFQRGLMSNMAGAGMTLNLGGVTGNVNFFQGIPEEFRDRRRSRSRSRRRQRSTRHAAASPLARSAAARPPRATPCAARSRLGAGAGAVKDCSGDGKRALSPIEVARITLYNE